MSPNPSSNPGIPAPSERTSRPGDSTQSGSRLYRLYEVLLEHHGPRNWWPGRSRLEIIIGAILVQNTSWKNVEKALRELRRRKLLGLAALRSIGEEELAEAIRPSGYFCQKARKIREFLALLDRAYGGSLRRMGSRSTEELRGSLLGVWGIGPETADSILLYAFEKPIFIVDSYTVRVLTRHGFVPESFSRSEVQHFVTIRLPRNVALFNDFHAQIVRLGQDHCGTDPRCEGCPLAFDLPSGGPAIGAF